MPNMDISFSLSMERRVEIGDENIVPNSSLPFAAVV